MDQREVEKKIAEILIAVEPKLEGQEIGPESTLSGLGLDSLKLVEIGVRVEDAFGEEIVFDDWLEEEQEKAEAGFSVGSLTKLILDTLGRST
ncbi:acyl carrier protein [Paraliomyxa miuraensis]|uniref:acyl carrier protein n=1 Tax=Paraliomyxa miuraensis TaxID=376150 RepID=UPI00225820A8|nr:acyl carrier protein [Paraliomyxa miuraensis]MCX4243004.1 acyl carrier protein [Paraliomyxa miuraensis]